VGERILTLQGSLQDKVSELQAALERVEQLQGLLPICMHCKRIRDTVNRWHRLEAYIQDHSEATFTHSLCSECMAKHYPDAAARAAAKDR
jgi:hypothetical protein